ncbi:hypothetical protein B0T25DRAFT_567397 [Lasiosphaeria hispida]|uniref:Uncharacterized protein n=1 Tax=Lasiosphaeria hispida TaxID=260671 RepID=A0AAJ0HNK9_9PEZI|nr:hypothetical protein B0T25DRAFT_567397 [Lasiosphaeria hispida]
MLTNTLFSIRTLYWFTYLQEDVYGSETDKMRVAPDCSGSRKGLLGQSGRCTLPEFLSYVWAPTKGDSKPDVTKVAWPAAAKGPNSATHGQIFNAIVKTRHADGTKIGGYGFHGNCDTEKLLPGAQSYSEALSRFGITSVSAMEETKTKHDSSEITQGERDVFSHWYREARSISEAIVAFREKEKWDYLKNKGGLEDKLGVVPVWTTKSGALGETTYSWSVLNVKETLEELDDTTVFYDTFKTLSEGDFGGYHAAWWTAKYARSCYDSCSVEHECEDDKA